MKILLSLFVFALIALVAAADSSLDALDSADDMSLDRRGWWEDAKKKAKSVGKKVVDKAKSVGKKAVDKAKSVGKDVVAQAKKFLGSLKQGLLAVLSVILPERIRKAIHESRKNRDPMPFKDARQLKAGLDQYWKKYWCSTCQYGRLLSVMKSFVQPGGVASQLNSAVGDYTKAWVKSLATGKKPSTERLRSVLARVGSAVDKARPKNVAPVPKGFSKSSKRDAEVAALQFIDNNNARLRKAMDEIRRETERFNVTRRDDNKKNGMGFWSIDLDATLIAGGQILFGMAINNDDGKAMFMICTHYSVGASLGVSAGISGGYDWKSRAEDYSQEKNWRGGYSGSFSVFADFYAGFELGFGSSRPFGHALGAGHMGFEDFDLGQVQFGLSGGIGAGPYTFLQGRCWTW